MKSLAPLAIILLVSACGGPPPPTIPALNQEVANELLRYDTKASNWLIYVQKTNPVCNWHLELPDQSAQPTEIDLEQIVWCGASPAPRALGASVIFNYNKADGHWHVTRFSS